MGNHGETPLADDLLFCPLADDLLFCPASFRGFFTVDDLIGLIPPPLVEQLNIILQSTLPQMTMALRLARRHRVL